MWPGAITAPDRFDSPCIRNRASGDRLSLYVVAR